MLRVNFAETCRHLIAFAVGQFGLHRMLRFRIADWKHPRRGGWPSFRRDHRGSIVFCIPGKFLILDCGTHQSEVIFSKHFPFFTVCFVPFRLIMHANLEMEAYVCSLQFTLNYDLHMPQELQLQMMTLGHAAARQPENRITAEIVSACHFCAIPWMRNFVDMKIWTYTSIDCIHCNLHLMLVAESLVPFFQSNRTFSRNFHGDIEDCVCLHQVASVAAEICNSQE